MAQTVRLENLDGARGLGWLPDVPDLRDYTPEHKEVAPLLAGTSVPKLEGGAAAKAPLPGKVDLRQWCSPVENQKELGSCTAHAGVGMLEYFERKAFGKHVDASRLFLYKATRKLLGLWGDSGASLRGDRRCDAALRRPAGALLALRRSGVRSRTTELLLRLRREVPGAQVLPARPPGNRPRHPDRGNQGQPGVAAAGNVRVGGLQLDPPDHGKRRQGPIPRPGRVRRKRPRDDGGRLRRLDQAPAVGRSVTNRREGSSSGTLGAVPGGTAATAGSPTTTSATTSPATGGC